MLAGGKAEFKSIVISALYEEYFRAVVEQLCNLGLWSTFRNKDDISLPDIGT